MSCLDNIVTLGVCPDDGTSLSGFKLINAPGISIKTLADTANETYLKGAELAMQKKELAINMVRNDFIAALHQNRVVTTISNPEYNTSQFNTGASVATYSGERGVVLHKANWRGKLRRLYIKEIQLYPLGSGDATLKIYDGYNVYEYAVTLTGGQINTFNEENLDGFPFMMNENSTYLKVLIDQSEFPFVSAPITCMVGCNGTAPNPCGWADGWDGAAAVKREGYGINVVFYCDCNYEQILCDLAKSYSGELIWLKWQIAIFEEAQKSNRFNNWIVYGADKIGDQIASLDAKYTSKWNALMEGALGILKTYRDDCLNCRGTRWVTNM